jgi:hypothetical protein
VPSFHKIYYFKKYVTNSWDGDISFKNQLLRKKFEMRNISLFILIGYLLLGINSPYMPQNLGPKPTGNQSKSRRHNPVETLFHSHRDLLKV